MILLVFTIGTVYFFLCVRNSTQLRTQQESIEQTSQVTEWPVLRGRIGVDHLKMMTVVMICTKKYSLWVENEKVNKYSIISLFNLNN